MLEAFLWSLAIFLARMTDVSMGTTRQILIFRGQRNVASLTAFFEILIWVLAVSRVITQLDKIYYMFAFAAGFATGNYLGSLIEEKIALGYVFAHVVPKNMGLAQKLRGAGFGVTVVEGLGLEGVQPIYNVLFERRETRRFLNLLKTHDKDAFYTILDVRARHGGYLAAARKKK